MAIVELSEVHWANPLQILLGFLFNCVFLKELECLAAPGQKTKNKKQKTFYPMDPVHLDFCIGPVACQISDSGG